MHRAYNLLIGKEVEKSDGICIVLMYLHLCITIYFTEMLVQEMTELGTKG